MLAGELEQILLNKGSERHWQRRRKRKDKVYGQEGNHMWQRKREREPEGGSALSSCSPPREKLDGLICPWWGAESVLYRSLKSNTNSCM